MKYFFNKDRFAWIDDMPLSEQIAWLLKIRCYIREYFDATATPAVPNISDICVYCRRKPFFKKKFWSDAAFGHFMRVMHRQGYLKQVIPYCHVDTSCHTQYKWAFYRPARHVIKRSDLNSGETAAKTPQIINAGAFQYESSDGVTRLRSGGELHIWEQLLKEPELEAQYEKKYYYRSEFKIPDFTVRVKSSGKEYIWEHFGMKEDGGYFVGMANKIEWYARAGLKHIDDGGRLIVTINDDDETKFHHDVTEAIRQMKSNL